MTDTTTTTAAETDEQKSIHAQFAEATEYKEPGAVSFVWNFDDDDEQSTGKGEGEKAETKSDEFTDTQQQADTTQSGKKEPPKPHQSTDATKKMSAETAAFLFDEGLQLLGIPITNYRFKKKFSDEERKRIFENDIEDKTLEELEDEDKVLKRKWNRLIKQRDNKIKAIPLQEDERDKVQAAFYQYFKVTGKDMPPEWLLGFMLGRIVVDRTLEIALD